MDLEEIRIAEKKICETLVALKDTLEKNLACDEGIKEQQVQIRTLFEQWCHAEKTCTIINGFYVLTVIISLFITIGLAVR